MSKSVLINDLELHWAKLSKPVAPFGTLQWELLVRTDSKDKKAELEAAGAKVKPVEEDGKVVYQASLKRKAVDRKGNDMDPPRVVDASRQPMDGATIGNGSRGNVILFSYDYSVQGRSGTACMITAVQVTDLIPYTPKDEVDFDDVDVAVGPEAPKGADLDFGQQ